MKMIMASILVLAISVVTHARFAYAYGGGSGGNGGAGAETTRVRGDPKTPPDGYDVIVIPTSTSSVGHTDTVVSTKEAIEHLDSLPPEVREEIEFFWLTATGIIIGYKTGGLSRGLQALIGALMGGGGTALKNIGKDPKDKSSILRSALQGVGVSQIPAPDEIGPIVQEAVSRVLDRIPIPSLPQPTPGPGGYAPTYTR